MQGQQSQQGPLFGAADRHRFARLQYLELAEEPDLHVPHRTTIAADASSGRAPCALIGAHLSGSSVTPQARAQAAPKTKHRGKEAQ